MVRADVLINQTGRLWPSFHTAKI